MSFEVGDEVYVKGKIVRVDDSDQEYPYKVLFGNENHEWLRASEAIPASRVTVAKARRAATQGDAGKLVLCFNIAGDIPEKRKLLAYVPGTPCPYVTEHTSDCELATRFRYAEVEE